MPPLPIPQYEPGWPPPTRAARYLIGTLCIGFAGSHALLHEFVELTTKTRDSRNDWVYVVGIFAVGGLLLIWPQVVTTFVTLLLRFRPWKTGGDFGAKPSWKQIAFWVAFGIILAALFAFLIWRIAR